MIKKYRLLIIVIIIGLLGFIFFPGGSKPIRNYLWQTAEPFGVFFNVVVDKPVQFFKMVFSIRSIIKQNSKLVKENLELQSKLAELREVSHENEVLKKELSYLETRPSLKLNPATIIGYSPTGYSKSLILNKGKKDGLSGGEAVISQGYLIGTVSEVRSNNSEVLLITNYRSLVPVVLQNSRGTGLLRGGLEGLTVEDIPLNIEIKEQEPVVTSGLGGTIPVGIPIGKATKIVSKQGDIFQTVVVVSPIDFSRLEILFIVNKNA